MTRFRSLPQEEYADFDPEEDDFLASDGTASIFGTLTLSPPFSFAQTHTLFFPPFSLSHFLLSSHLHSRPLLFLSDDLNSERFEESPNSFLKIFVLII